MLQFDLFCYSKLSYYNTMIMNLKLSTDRFRGYNIRRFGDTYAGELLYLGRVTVTTTYKLLEAKNIHT